MYKPPAISNKLSRAQEVSIHQLRTGASPLVRSCWARYMSMPEEERLCPNGCSKKEDVQHIFWDCPMYNAQRLKHFGTVTPDEKILFKDEQNILAFLEDIGHSTAPTVDAAEAAE